MEASPHVFDATLAAFEQEVILASREQPVLVDFWAEWCGPCKSLGPVLDKLAAEFNGGFRLAKVDVDAEQQLAGYFQIKSIPTVMLLKDGQIVDGFPGALPEGQVREFLKHHGVEPRPAGDTAADAVEEAAPAPVDPHEEVLRLRAALNAEPDKDSLKLDLALALLATGAVPEAERLLDALPADLGTDDRAVRARARLGFAALLRDAPPRWRRPSPLTRPTCAPATCSAPGCWSRATVPAAWSSSWRCCGATGPTRTSSRSAA
jgi:putative thioredoxin